MGTTQCSIDGCLRPAVARTWCRPHWKHWRRWGDPTYYQTAKPRQSPLRKSQADRLWGKVNRSNPESCWEWAGSRDGYGYGYFRMQPSESMWRAHRAAWVITFGPVPDGNRVLHRCDNPPCINPAHLFLGTDQDNVADRVAKNRSSRAVTHFGETSPLAKLTATEVAEIRRRYAEGFVYQRELASEFGISQTQVGRIVRGVRWKQAPAHPSQS